MNVNPPKIKQGGKTANAVRQVPIPPILVDYLIEYKQQAKILTPYVCYNAGGRLLSGAAFRQMWDSYLIDLNVKYGYANQNVSKYDPKGLPMRIERFTPHYLRHPYVKHKLKNLSDYWPDRLSAKDKPARPVFLLSFQVLFMLSQSLNP